MTSKNLYNLKSDLLAFKSDASIPWVGREVLVKKAERLFDRTLTALEELEARLTILEREQKHERDEGATQKQAQTVTAK